MPKLTIKKNDTTFEISDLTLEQVKELAGLNGHAPSRRRSSQIIKPTATSYRTGEPDYKGFYEEIGDRAKKFFAILRQYPNGVTGEVLAEKLGFSGPNQMGGLTGAGMGRPAKRFHVDVSQLYVKEREKLDTGEWRTTYKPGADMAKLQ